MGICELTKMSFTFVVMSLLCGCSVCCTSIFSVDDHDPGQFFVELKCPKLCGILTAIELGTTVECSSAKTCTTYEMDGLGK